VPRPASAAASLSAAAMGAAIALLGVTAGSAIGGAVLVSAGTAAIAARGFGPFTDYPTIVLRLGVWIAIALAGFTLAAQRARGRPLRNTARFAAAFSAAALLLKLIVLLHPDMPIGDAMFHAHRFQGVLGGRLYFTSVAPGGYAFPYPPGLYVFAAVFSGFVHRGAGDVTLLRVVTASVDAAFGLLLYWIAARTWDNRLAGAIAVAIYHLTPLNFAVLTTGNLTNAFAQSVAIAALALMAAPTLTLERWTMVLLLTIVLVVAFLSHTSTLAILFAASIAIAALFLLRREPSLRSSGAAIALAASAAAVIAFFAYYAYFMDTYRLELARIGRETAAAAPAAGGRAIGDRLHFVPYALALNIGAPVLLLAFLGAARLARRPHVDRLALVLAGWLAACAAFLAIGVVTPIDMRYYLAALPALAIAAGYGAARAWHDGWPPQRTLWRVTVAGLLAAAISVGFHHWWSALG
jgi:4-amino-4-deoxy-L-arabinose transferase-like glycosyltransferase